MTEWEKNCYGCSESDLDVIFASNIERVGTEMFVMGILSDVQHMVEHGHAQDDIRKTLNIAKYFLGRQQDQRRAA